MLKRNFFRVADFLLGRKKLIRFSKALLDYGQGDNNGNMVTNGELFLLRRHIRGMAERKGEFIVFDVGANIGDWTVSLLGIMEEDKITDNASVYCFEPSRATFAFLQSRLSKHPFSPKVKLENLGLGNAQEIKKLYINKSCPGTNCLWRRRTESLGIIYQETEEVKIVTLDSYCTDNAIKQINFLKIDTEGYDLIVLKGAESLLKSQAIDHIQFEYGGSWIDSRNLFMDAFDFLSGFDYSVGKVMPKGVEFYDKYDQRLETFQMANFFACRKNLAGNFRHIKPWMG